MYATVDVLPEPPPPTSAIVRGSVPSLRNTSMRPASTWRTSFLMLRGDVKGRPWTTASRTTSAASAWLRPAATRRCSAASAASGRSGSCGSDPLPGAGRGARRDREAGRRSECERRSLLGLGASAAPALEDGLRRGLYRRRLDRGPGAGSGSGWPGPAARDHRLGCGSGAGGAGGASITGLAAASAAAGRVRHRRRAGARRAGSLLVGLRP